MKIDFENIERSDIPGFKGGEGVTSTRMYTDPRIKIMMGELAVGASIGLHTHETSSETIYILEGEAKMIFDGAEEHLAPGDVSYCPLGYTHSLINIGPGPLRFFAVVPEHK